MAFTLKSNIIYANTKCSGRIGSKGKWALIIIEGVVLLQREMSLKGQGWSSFVKSSEVKTI